MTERLTLEYHSRQIKIDGTCVNCALRKDIDDGMNITSYCVFDNGQVDKLTSKCHLNEEDKKELNGKLLVRTLSIE